MSGAHFSVQTYIGSRLKLRAVWAITHADLLKYQGLLFTVKMYCQIYVPFFQDGSFNWGLKRKGYFNFFSFFVPHMYFFKCTKNILIKPNLKPLN